MKFDISLVNKYLTIIHDSNPIHKEIVPGQLVCEWLLEDVEWQHYTVKYKNPIYIDEILEKVLLDNRIKCINPQGMVKIIVEKQ
ncbi:hypothetical protein [Mammaliicoccus sciuri]|uniref:hypothetical protein n=1 Tax=Mammaliicoccus sciuri TaxID=1296 RepID=UPI0018B0BF8C|nr:hypothetical protein [Mammaliicoccus sciuri]MBF9297116.1 hypothetical protein [Staphylococcus schleiferi]MCJ0942517.1 hypothetical protein [Mammaliicoccus sciuri]MDO0947533.1 hypothetical protein [Mammaliicoccus sciuri]MDO0953981.1 hypothetical protein [Mammaliicoccus sciuri]